MSDKTAEKAWTQGQVRETFVRGREQHADFPGINNSRVEFESWLAAHDAEVRDAALKEAESDERCVHAVDGPDWAGLREPASWQELAMAAKARCEKAEAERDALQGSLTIESGAVQELRARSDAMEADRDEWRSIALRERAESAALQARSNAIRALHTETAFNWTTICSADDDKWPCLTIRALDAVAPEGEQQ
jgi:hypothetical protein